MFGRFDIISECDRQTTDGQTDDLSTTMRNIARQLRRNRWHKPYSWRAQWHHRSLSPLFSPRLCDLPCRNGQPGPITHSSCPISHVSKSIKKVSLHRKKAPAGLWLATAVVSLLYL